MNTIQSPPARTKSKRGRKQKYGEPTALITIRVPLSRVSEIRTLIKSILENI